MERRSRVRYPVEVNVSYRGFENKRCICGTGQATNLSSGGVLVATPDEHHVRAGARVEIGIEWACPFHETAPLNLVATGRAVRRGQYGFAVAFSRREFRIMESPLQFRIPTRELSLCAGQSG
ncbi:MAG: PilZ domain-containing protein [Bryobacteraceae bacterium]